jgi:hypothetical protein
MIKATRNFPHEKEKYFINPQLGFHRLYRSHKMQVLGSQTLRMSNFQIKLNSKSSISRATAIRSKVKILVG